MLEGGKLYTADDIENFIKMAAAIGATDTEMSEKDRRECLALLNGEPIETHAGEPAKTH